MRDSCQHESLDAPSQFMKHAFNMTLGERIRAARKARGLSQPALARLCGWDSQSRISQYETDNREPQLDDLKKIARALGVPIESLVTGTNEIPHVSSRLRLTIKKPGVEEGPDVGPYAMVPVVGTAQLGPDGYWVAMEYPVGHGDGSLDVPTRDHQAYALRVKGDSMAPAIRDGWYVVVEPNYPVHPGEYVVVVTKDGRSMVKELLWQRNGQIVLMSVADGFERITLDMDEVEKLHHVAFIAPPSKKRL